MQAINATTYAMDATGDRLTPPVITLGGKDPSKFALEISNG